MSIEEGGRIDLIIPACPNCGRAAAFSGSAYKPCVSMMDETLGVPFGEAEAEGASVYTFDGRVKCDHCGMSTGYMPGFSAVERWKYLAEAIAARKEGTE